MTLHADTWIPSKDVLCQVWLKLALVLKGRNENVENEKVYRQTDGQKNCQLFCLTRISEAFIHTCKNSVYHLIIKQNSQV